MEQTELTLAPLTSYQITRKLLEERKIYLWEPVDGQSSLKIVQQLTYLESREPGAPIHMHINCPGGVVTAGYAIYDTMQDISSPVYTYCLGYAASMGSILLSGGARGHRYIYPSAEVMIHQPSIGGLQDTLANIEIHARHILKTKNLTARILAENCGQTVEQVLRDFDRDYWMDATEAIAYGIVDRMVAT